MKSPVIILIVSVFAVLIFGGLVFASDSTPAQSVAVNAAQATYICRLQPETNPAEDIEGNYSSAPYLHSRGPQGAQGVRSDMLVRFDLSSVKGVVERATIRMRKTSAPYSDSRNTGTNIISAYPVLVDWDQTKLTWKTFYKQNTQLFGRQVSAASVGDKEDYYDWELPASLVQKWIDYPSSNHGIIFISQITRNPFINTYFYSKNTQFPPQLVIETAKPGQAVPRSDSNLTLKNKSMALRFDLPENGLGLTSIFDIRNNVEHIAKSGSRQGIWRLTFRDLASGKNHVVDSPGNALCSVQQYQENGSSVLECRWNGVQVASDGGTCDVKAVVLMDDLQSDVRWRIQVDNHSKTHSLWSVDYPVVPNVGVKGETAYTQLWAAVGAWKTEFKDPIDYDLVGGMWPMQFFALSTHNAGLYISTMDSRQFLKHIYFDMGKDFHYTHFPQSMDLPAQTYAMPYEVDMKIFTGDWYDAAKIYRDWALDQPWTARGPLKFRRSHGSMAESGIVDTNLWLKDSRPADDSLVKDTIAIKDYFGVATGLHLYCWHDCFFDANYPEYLPVLNVDEFKKSVGEMQRAGITVMPYVNAMIWNATIPSFETVRADACCNVDGSLSAQNYNGLDFGNMWPGSKLWQDKLAYVIRELAKCGIRATYLDLMGACPPQLDFARNHGHAGGGASDGWVDGYRDLVARVRQECRKEGIEMPFVTEVTSECYMDAVQGFLTWWTRDDGAVPILPVVYGGYAVYIGEGVYQNESDLHFCMRTARDFTWGTALGWGSDSGTDVARYKSLINTPTGEFLRTLLRHRVVARDYLVYGEMLRELPNLAPQVMLTGKCTTQDATEEVGKVNPVVTNALTLPAVINSVWHALDGSSAVVIVNLDTKPHAVSYKADMNALGLSPCKSGYILEHIREDGKVEKLRSFGADLAWQRQINPREVYILKIEPKRSN